MFDFSAYLDEPPGTVMPVSGSAGSPLRAFLTLYGHAITRGEPRSRLHAPAVGGEGSGSGVAKFEAATLGQLLRSHEDTTGVPKCKGLARPVFEMKASQASQHAYVLMPGASPVGLPRAECFVVVYKEEY